MKENKKTLKRKKKIIILMLIFMIILIILVIILKSLIKSNDDTENSLNQELGSYVVDFTEYSANFENFDEVLAELPMKSITMRSKVQDFAIDFLKDVYNLRDSEDEEIEEYFNANKDQIEEFLYNVSLKSFKELIEKISTIESAYVEFTNCVFDVDTLSNTDEEYTFDITITYNDKYDFEFTIHVLIAEDIEEDCIKFE